MRPLVVTARLSSAISMPRTGIALDALLASQVALRLELPPPRHAADCVPLEIPIARSECDRFYRASFAVWEWEQHETRWVNRRPVIAEAQMLGSPKIRRMNITAGADKGYRLPLEVGHVVDDTLTWWCVGDAEPIRDLLATVVGLGKKRSVGLGRVAEWRVDECEPWGDGFPVVRDGKPLRTLPADCPGLEDPPLAMRVVDLPYWAHEREELAACPAR